MREKGGGAGDSGAGRSGDNGSSQPDVISLAGRLAEGLALLGFLLVAYAPGIAVGRLSSVAQRRWNAWIHPLTGRWLASCCRRHGALLIKIGQTLASRPDLIPPPIVTACATLRDAVPPRPWRVVERALRLAYRDDWRTHFSSIEPTALAAASFGQVHRAQLRDGSPVAIKVQYPDLRAKVAIDVWLARRALTVFAWVRPGLPLQVLADEVERTSREEQDYLCEAESSERLAPVCAKHGVRVPSVNRALTRETVLVMEFAPGTSLARLDLHALPQALRLRVATTLIDTWVSMVADEGFLHGDPHAGNLLLDGETLWLLDFGMTATITARQRLGYVAFLRAVAGDDPDALIDALAQLGMVQPEADRAALRVLARELWSQLAHLNPRAWVGSRRERELSDKVDRFLSRSQGLVLPRHSVLVIRSLTLLEGLIGELVPEQSLLDLAKPRLSRLSTARTLLGDWWSTTRERLTRWLDLPNQVDALATALRTPAQTSPLLLALLVIAGLMLPEPLRLWVAGIAAVGLLLSVLRR